MEVKDTRYGKFMFLEGDQFIGKSLQEYGESDFHEVEFLKRLITDGDVVIDVGANIGTVSVPLAQVVGSSGYVLALEAHTFLFFTLCGNLALNQLTNVQAFNRAASHASGGVCYFPSVDVASEMNFGGIQLAGILNAKDGEGRKCDNPVAAIALDDLNLAKPKLIKIDVEGMEVPVLEGARKTIDRATPVLYVEFIGEREGILNFLAEVGYDWELHEPPLFNPNNFLYNKVDVLRSDDLPIVSSNLFCYPKGSRPDVDDEFLIDLDASDNPRHREIRELRDSINERENSVS